MVENTKVSGLKTTCMVLVSTLGKTEGNMKLTMLMTKSMDMEFIIG